MVLPTSAAWLSLVMSLYVSSLALAQGSPSNYSGDAAISIQRLEEDLAFIAGDDFAGRFTGELGAQTAGRWIESRLKRLNLEPIDGTFIHPFSASPLRLNNELCNLTLGGDFPHGDNFQPHPSAPAGSASGEVVFVGYGINSSEYEYDDLWGLDLVGKVALVFRWEPQANERDSKFNGKKLISAARLQAKIKLLEDAGAVAVLVADPPGVEHAKIEATGAPFWPSTSKLYNQLLPLLSAQTDPKIFTETNFTVKSVADQFYCMLQSQTTLSCEIPVAYVGRRIVDEVFKGRELNAIEWVKETDVSGSGSGFETALNSEITVAFETSERVGWNVVGVLPGSDPQLRDEYLVISSHYDHVGSNEAGDIWNGADDNGSGVVANLALAESLVNAKVSPRRSICFVFFSGEEIGLIGASQFLAQGVLPVEQISAMLNFDMVGRATNNTVHVIGTKSSPILPKLTKRAAKGLNLHYDTEHEEFFDRSDQAIFYRAGIPVIFFNTNEHADYHTPNDKWDAINYSSLEQITLMARRAADSLANLGVRPAFVDGYSRLNPFFGRAPQLLAPWPVPFGQRLDY